MYELLRRLLFLPPPGSGMAREIDALHFFVISVTMLGAAAVGFTSVFMVVRYRSRDPAAATPHISISLRREIGYVAGLLTLFFVWWAIGFHQYMGMLAAPPNALDVYVTGKQWMWKFADPSGKSSVGVLVVPSGRPVRAVITSRDVVHSFYVPALRLKMDAVPGRYTSFWFQAEPGTYPVYCAEYCGYSHSRMWASVVALGPSDYQRYEDGEVPPAVAQAVANAAPFGGRLGQDSKPLADRGREAAERYACFSCHTVDGQPHIGPTWRGLYGSLRSFEDGTQIRADEGYLTESMMEPQKRVVSGFKPVMPTYRGILAQPDAAAIVVYIKSIAEPVNVQLVSLPHVEAVAAPPDAGAAGSTGRGDRR